MPYPTILTRRAVLSGISLSLLAQAGFAQSLPVPGNGARITPPQAHDLATSGAITLVDIRRPDEWAATGSGASAQRLDLRRPDFIQALTTLVEGDRAAPIALICARGVRSNWTAQQLRQAGFRRIIDVPEGMLGGRAGPGWIKRGLPVMR